MTKRDWYYLTQSAQKIELEAAREEAAENLRQQAQDQRLPEVTQAYVRDVRRPLEESSIMEQKTFLRSFVERIGVRGSEVEVVYRIPMPPGPLAGRLPLLLRLPFMRNGSPSRGKIRTFLRFSILARVRFYTKRSPETGYRFLGPESLRDAVAAVMRDSQQLRRQRRNPVALAQEWQQVLDSGQAADRADLARELGVTRAHVTQVLRLLRLPPEAQQAILALGDPVEGRHIGVHTLRGLHRLPVAEQERRVEALTQGIATR